VYAVPAVIVCPVNTVRVNVPALQAPVDGVPPDENLPASGPVRAMGLVAIAFASPVIVTLELSVGNKFTPVTRVTVMVLAALARGVLC